MGGGNPCWSVQYLMNHSTEHNHKLCAYECTEQRNHSDRGEELQAEQCVGREVGRRGGGGSVTVLDCTESHRVPAEEEDVEESCNNRKEQEQSS